MGENRPKGFEIWPQGVENQLKGAEHRQKDVKIST